VKIINLFKVMLLCNNDYMISINNKINKIKKSNTICLNCGTHGHTTRVCNFPITSYGLICFKRINSEIKYIMIQKKDTISYTEFLRGKYEINNLQYMKLLLGMMTKEEKDKLLNRNFNDLWKLLWSHGSENGNRFQKEYNKSLNKFNKLKMGFYMSLKDKSIQFINLEVLIANSGEALPEQEWEFPKGRRKLCESDLSCALREFEEEVGIGQKIVIHDTFKQFEETFTGSNGIRYRNIYYIAQYVGDASSVRFDATNAQQAKEVRDVRWFSYEEALARVRHSTNHEKRELFKRVNSLVHKNYL